MTMIRFILLALTFFAGQGVQEAGTELVKWLKPLEHIYLQVAD